MALTEKSAARIEFKKENMNAERDIYLTKWKEPNILTRNQVLLRITCRRKNASSSICPGYGSSPRVPLALRILYCVHTNPCIQRPCLSSS